MVTEELQPPTSANFFPNWSNWHPFNNTMSGDNPPCYKEFMNLMECLKTMSKCETYYVKLVECVRKHGYDE